jgi:hypothetical protein
VNGLKAAHSRSRSRLIIVSLRNSVAAPPRREVVFQAAIKLLRSHLNGTIRLIVSLDSPEDNLSDWLALLCLPGDPY